MVGTNAVPEGEYFSVHDAFTMRVIEEAGQVPASVL